MGYGDPRSKHQHCQICAWHRDSSVFEIYSYRVRVPIDTAVLYIEIAPAVAELRQQVKIIDSQALLTSPHSLAGAIESSPNPKAFPEPIPLARVSTNASLSTTRSSPWKSTDR